MHVEIRDARPDEYEQIGTLLVAAYAEYAGCLEPGGWERMRTGLLQVEAHTERGVPPARPPRWGRTGGAPPQ